MYIFYLNKMGHGLTNFKETDNMFKKTFIYRLVFSGLFTGVWYQFSKSARLFKSPTILTKSLPIAFLLGLYYSKGFALNLSAAEIACDNASTERHDRYLNYKSELRNKKIID
jgi:hypothetical protein